VGRGKLGEERVALEINLGGKRGKGGTGLVQNGRRRKRRSSELNTGRTLALGEFTRDEKKRGKGGVGTEPRPMRVKRSPGVEVPVRKTKVLLSEIFPNSQDQDAACRGWEREVNREREKERWDPEPPAALAEG